MRLFVAAWPPGEVRDALRSIPRPTLPGVRWMPEDTWHVTLRFLGEVADPDPVVDSLRAEVPGHGPQPATLDAATTRLGPVLVVRVAGLDRLASLVRSATAPAGDDPRSDPFVGHVTVARARGRGVPDALVGLGLAGGPVTWSVDEVALVRSITGAAGARYETRATVPLG
ncbi:RNA 2',3'-cyclic phosphodiesterase [Iamia sp. SCSIO 61187]|uniref:RNA 2',3'-cyclic phosphodiesterase n=1 Tax=Iamia sp. SCSIO 61187 TaxID=2722752 RepID=UPI001C632A60|nr:RNA 2',3'-cyclic phosphodiesterase [Iamia sp. SCSIO 61187]QYG93299.1 RNA 2',3'-cyclic phosphodiesterase [Iamia sp. SCSIO 61187]